MTDRRSLSLRDKLEIIARQARCPLCGERLGEITSLDFDHEIPLALGGSDTVDNLRAVHRQPCHAIKTSGRRGESKLSIRDGDQGKIAKVKRLIKRNAVETGRAGQEPAHGRGPASGNPLRAAAKRQWPKRKLESKNNLRRNPK